MRKVKQTFLIRPNGDCSAEWKLKKNELVFLEHSAYQGTQKRLLRKDSKLFSRDNFFAEVIRQTNRFH